MDDAAALCVRGALPPVPALLCVAHPGHELRVYAWLTLARPAVAVLTAGLGRSRLPATRETLEETACTVGPSFGAMTDAAAYRAIMARDAALFDEAADRLARCIAESGARSIVGDAARKPVGRRGISESPVQDLAGPTLAVDARIPGISRRSMEKSWSTSGSLHRAGPQCRTA
jgi:hypothetical protein